MQNLKNLGIVPLINQKSPQNERTLRHYGLLCDYKYKGKQMILGKLKLCSFLLLLVGINFTSQAQIVPYDSAHKIDNYEKYIEAFRSKEKASFRNEKTTLLSKEFFPRFTGLNYFSINKDYRVTGTLTKLTEQNKTDLEMTDGGYYGFVHYGNVKFNVNNEDVVLQVYEFPSRKPPATAIFLPFKDATTGKETYGGGRFMIVNIPKGKDIVVDFNHAINPICVYDPDHACPVPPRSNRIKSKVTAGAMMYFDPNDPMAKP